MTLRARLHRRGFSLLEMLIVIGILMIFMGISIGAVMRTPKVSALAGTEQLIADVIRQARHTARSSGAPVMIEIAKGDRQVMGVSQLPLWASSFEAIGTPSAADPDLVPPANSTGAVGLGLSGRGLITDPGPPVAPLPPIQLDQAHRLVRKTVNGRTEGFYVSCAVRPRNTSGIEPLITVGGEAEDACTCGLRLERVARAIQTAPTDLSGNPAKKFQPGGPAVQPPVYESWKIVGWVRIPGRLLSDTTIDSVTDSLQSLELSGSQDWGVAVDRTKLDTGTDDIADPILDDRWLEVGLLYDGQRLELYHDRRLVAVKDCSGALDPGDSQVRLGYGKFFAGTGTADQQRYLAGIIDDARLMRLGVDRAGVLPSGVTPNDYYRISVRPDGRVDLISMSDTVTKGKKISMPDPSDSTRTIEVFAPVPATSPAVLVFNLPNGGGAAGDTVEMSVYPDGRLVTNRLDSVVSPP